VPARVVLGALVPAGGVVTGADVHAWVEIRVGDGSWRTLPTSAFMDRVDQLPVDRPLLVVCHVGGRSAAVAGYLLRSGRANVVNVAGGMDAWQQAGLPVRRGPLEAGEGDLPAG